MKLGLICAIEPEMTRLAQDFVADKIKLVAGRHFHQGVLYGQPVVMVLSGVGKVAAAITTTLLIDRFGVDTILLVGTAGGIDRSLSVGDVVIAEECLQFDMLVDATPTFRIPVLNKSSFPTNQPLSVQALAVANCYLNTTFLRTLQRSPETVAQLSLSQPKCVTGTIASGDTFVSDAGKKEWLRTQIPNLRCVEMEGAATAQVCDAYGIPYAVIRVISDQADEQASHSFELFIEHMASVIIQGIVQDLLQSW